MHYTFIVAEAPALQLDVITHLLFYIVGIVRTPVFVGSWQGRQTILKKVEN